MKTLDFENKRSSTLEIFEHISLNIINNNGINLNLFEEIKYSKGTTNWFIIDFKTKRLYEKQILLNYHFNALKPSIALYNIKVIYKNHSLYKIKRLLFQKEWDIIDYAEHHFNAYSRLISLTPLESMVTPSFKFKQNINGIQKTVYYENPDNALELTMENINLILIELLKQYNPIEYEILKLSN